MKAENMIYEKKNQKPISFAAFRKRILRNLFLSFLIMFVSVLGGMIGYHICGDLDWLDSFYNTSMILTGMGPVNCMTTVSGKLFASFYALYSGIAFLTTVAVVLVPVLHRVMHKFHFDTKE